MLSQHSDLLEEINQLNIPEEANTLRAKIVEETPFVLKVLFFSKCIELFAQETLENNYSMDSLQVLANSVGLFNLCVNSLSAPSALSLIEKGDWITFGCLGKASLRVRDALASIMKTLNIETDNEIVLYLLENGVSKAAMLIASFNAESENLIKKIADDAEELKQQGGQLVIPMFLNFFHQYQPLLAWIDKIRLGLKTRVATEILRVYHLGAKHAGTSERYHELTQHLNVNDFANIAIIGKNPIYYELGCILTFKAYYTNSLDTLNDAMSEFSKIKQILLTMHTTGQTTAEDKITANKVTHSVEQENSYISPKEQFAFIAYLLYLCLRAELPCWSSKVAEWQLIQNKSSHSKLLQRKCTFLEDWLKDLLAKKQLVNLINICRAILDETSAIKFFYDETLQHPIMISFRKGALLYLETAIKQLHSSQEAETFKACASKLEDEYTAFKLNHASNTLSELKNKRSSFVQKNLEHINVLNQLLTNNHKEISSEDHDRYFYLQHGMLSSLCEESIRIFDQDQNDPPDLICLNICDIPALIRSHQVSKSEDLLGLANQFDLCKITSQKAEFAQRFLKSAITTCKQINAKDALRELILLRCLMSFFVFQHFREQKNNALGQLNRENLLQLYTNHYQTPYLSVEEECVMLTKMLTSSLPDDLKTINHILHHLKEILETLLLNDSLDIALYEHIIIEFIYHHHYLTRVIQAINDCYQTCLDALSKPILEIQTLSALISSLDECIIVSDEIDDESPISSGKLYLKKAELNFKCWEIASNHDKETYRTNVITCLNLAFKNDALFDLKIFCEISKKLNLRFYDIDDELKKITQDIKPVTTSTRKNRGRKAPKENAASSTFMFSVLRKHFDKLSQLSPQFNHAIIPYDDAKPQTDNLNCRLDFLFKEIKSTEEYQFVLYCLDEQLHMLTSFFNTQSQEYQLILIKYKLKALAYFIELNIENTNTSFYLLSYIDTINKIPKTQHLDERLPDFYLRLIQLHLAKNEFDLAEEKINEAISKFPKHYPFLLAKIAFYSNKLVNLIQATQLKRDDTKTISEVDQLKKTILRDFNTLKSLTEDGYVDAFKQYQTTVEPILDKFYNQLSTLQKEAERLLLVQKIDTEIHALKEKHSKTKDQLPATNKPPEPPTLFSFTSTPKNQRKLQSLKEHHATIMQLHASMSKNYEPTLKLLEQLRKNQEALDTLIQNIPKETNHLDDEALFKAQALLIEIKTLLNQQTELCQSIKKYSNYTAYTAKLKQFLIEQTDFKRRDATEYLKESKQKVQEAERINRIAQTTYQKLLEAYCVLSNNADKTKHELAQSEQDMSDAQALVATCVTHEDEVKKKLETYNATLLAENKNITCQKMILQGVGSKISIDDIDALYRLSVDLKAIGVDLFLKGSFVTRLGIYLNQSNSPEIAAFFPVKDIDLLLYYNPANRYKIQEVLLKHGFVFKEHDVVFKNRTNVTQPSYINVTKPGTSISFDLTMGLENAYQSNEFAALQSGKAIFINPTAKKNANNIVSLGKYRLKVGATKGCERLFANACTFQECLVKKPDILSFQSYCRILSQYNAKLANLSSYQINFDFNGNISHHDDYIPFNKLFPLLRKEFSKHFLNSDTRRLCFLELYEFVKHGIPADTDWSAKRFIQCFYAALIGPPINTETPKILEQFETLTQNCTREFMEKCSAWKSLNQEVVLNLIEEVTQNQIDLLRETLAVKPQAKQVRKAQSYQPKLFPSGKCKSLQPKTSSANNQRTTSVQLLRK